MGIVTKERFDRGWRYQRGGARLTTKAPFRVSAMSVVRKMCWDEAGEFDDAQPMWVVQDENSVQLGAFIHADDAMAFAEATYELEKEI